MFLHFQTSIDEKEEESVALAEQIRARLERLESLDRSRLYDVTPPHPQQVAFNCFHFH